MSKVKKAIIPAAGLGTRFLPFTKATPKEMLPIVDKPTLQYIVEELVASDITQILIVTGHNKKCIEDHFDVAVELEGLLRKTGKFELLEIAQQTSYMADIHFVRQREAKGLGHAILCGKHFVGNEPFAVLLGDDVVYTGDKTPCIKQLINEYDKCENTVIGVQKVAKSEVNKYGVIDIKQQKGKTFEVKGMVEKPAIEEAPSQYAVLGRYVISPEIFELLEKQEVGKGGEIQLTDALAKLAPSGKLMAYEFEGKRYDMGDKLGYLSATVEYALRDKKLAPAFKEYLKDILKTL